MSRRRPRAKALPAVDQRRRYRGLRIHFMLQLDQRVGREKAVLRKTIDALTRRLR
jgi:hypothetical protein